MTNLGTVIQLYLRVNNIGVREFAKTLGISPSTVSRVITGGDMSQDVMLKVINWLFAGKEGLQ